MEKWIAEYVDKLFPIDRKLVDINAAYRIKAEHTPTKLYKFRGVADYAFKNFENDNLSLSEASKFNDPFECALNVVSKHYFFKKLRNTFSEAIIGNEHFSDEEIEKMKVCPKNEFYEIIENRSELFSKYPKGTLKLVNESFIGSFCDYVNNSFCERNISNMYICSLSETNKSSAMWAHYADEFRGFCLEYDFSKILWAQLWCFLNPVIYTNVIPDFSEYFANRNNFNNLISVYAAMIKAKDWSYEHEWRLIIPSGRKESGYFLVNAPKPRALYLGLCISKELEDKLVELAKRKDIKVFKMIRPSSTFKIEFKEV